MIFRRFTIQLIVRLALVGASMATLVWLLVRPGLYSVTVIAVVILIILVIELWTFVSRTNREVARFLDAARYADFSQRFNFEKEGAGFKALGDAITDIIERMRERRAGHDM